ncbi:MAG: uroporphyrinogen decarboxylase family protein [Armatimonadota bacterium]|nr:uroporphyrinogen decarboxylase family protein [Armatimonadota bacterium]
MPVPNLQKRLEKLDSLIDINHIRQSERLLEDTFSYKAVDRLPILNPDYVPGWETYPYSEAFYDMEKMLINELAGVWQGANLRDDRMYTIRANYGVGTVASLFGCKISLTMNNMPWCEPLSETELMKALDRGVPDLSSGLGTRVFETEQFYLDTLSQYPNLSKAVHVFICDTQGPFDTAHLIMGHRIYTEIYDNPDLVHRLLDVVTETYIAFTKAQKEIIGECNDWSYHSQMKVRGGIRICEDAPTNISSSAYLEFCRPYNERCLAEFNGGWIHYCGKGYQIFPHVISTPGLCGVNFGNPEVQDLQYIYSEASKRGIGIISWSGRFTSEDEKVIKTGISLVKSAERRSPEAALY